MSKSRFEGSTLIFLKKPIFKKNKPISKISFKDVMSLLKEASKNKTAVIFNFGEKELEYANPAWLVIEVKRFKP